MIICMQSYTFSMKVQKKMSIIYACKYQFCDETYKKVFIYINFIIKYLGIIGFIYNFATNKFCWNKYGEEGVVSDFVQGCDGGRDCEGGTERYGY